MLGAKFDELMEREVAPHGSKWPRLAVGVFSKAGCEEAPFREVIRSTWMQLPWICPLSKIDTDTNCSIFAGFVLGRVAGTKMTVDPDMTVLSIPETMNCGKTRAWFHYAVERYPAATHIAKMDMDAFPHWSQLLAGIQNFASPCKNVFGGRSWGAWGHRQHGRDDVPLLCKEPAYCPPEDCGMPEGNDFLKYKSAAPGCFSFMQGGLYFMSRQLASEVSKDGGWWHVYSKNCYPEDVATGRAVMQYATESRTCVAALSYDTDVAYWHAEGPRRWSPEAERVQWKKTHPVKIRRGVRRG